MHNGGMNTIQERVLGVLPRLVEAQRESIEHVAKELGMSTRTLQRKLEREGTTFREVVAIVKKDLAMQMMANRRPASEVGFALGFSQPSAFHRAFRRWTGLSSRAFRRALREGTATISTAPPPSGIAPQTISPPAPAESGYPEPLESGLLPMHFRKTA